MGPIKLGVVQKITFVLRKINKNCCHQSTEGEALNAKAYTAGNLPPLLRNSI